MPQWIAREYLARRGGARFSPGQVGESACTLLGYQLNSIKVEGTFLPRELLDVSRQPEVGEQGFMLGSRMLSDFFKQELRKFDSAELEPLEGKSSTAA